VVILARQPLANTPLALDTVEGLHSIPGHPFVRALLTVASLASGDHVAGAIFSALRLRAHMVNSQVGKAGVNDWSSAAVCAAIVPGIFD